MECQHEEGEDLSPIFLIDGSFRLTLSLKKLNDQMPYMHFKVETIKYVLNLLTPNPNLAKIDIKYPCYLDFAWTPKNFWKLAL